MTLGVARSGKCLKDAQTLKRDRQNPSSSVPNSAPPPGEPHVLPFRDSPPSSAGCCSLGLAPPPRRSPVKVASHPLPPRKSFFSRSDHCEKTSNAVLFWFQTSKRQERGGKKWFGVAFFKKNKVAVPDASRLVGAKRSAPDQVQYMKYRETPADDCKGVRLGRGHWPRICKE